MTEEERARHWEEQFMNCEDPAQAAALLRRRPKGAKTVRSGGMRFDLGDHVQGDTPLLTKLQTGKKK